MLSASLSLCVLLFSSPSPFLSSRRRRTTAWEQLLLFFSPSQSCQCGKGDRIMPLDCTVLSVEGRHRQEPTPHSKPCSLNPDSCETEYNQPLSGGWTTTRCGISFPQGIPSYRDELTVPAGYSCSSHNMLTSERSIQSE